ncbi:hypothetical protein [Photobacterium angustum]|uniref:hypothetical protein n=1 Tax=Photobacterium angustum TaxID=661 RepID=UPI0005DD6C8C|nr:hypothetical protein [Photobacterium angustum]KJG00098.1 hypothetical protein UB35_19795 [Photobacterium angustum]PSV61698.1 hypothetical protein CTM95_20565 [Photobacterium angustum]
MNTIRIRKNASRKIASLISGATSFKKETYSMRMDDCMESNGFVSIDSAEFQSWFYANYDDMRIHATYDENEQLIEVRFSGEYYFCDEVVVTFEPVVVEQVEEKPVLTFDQVTEALENGYVSPLNSDEKREVSNVVEFPQQGQTDADKSIESVFVDMAEHRTIDAHAGQTLAVSDYELLAHAVAHDSKLGEGEGYDKTFIVVNLRDGRSLKFRHDITLRTKSLMTEWSKYVDYVRAGKQA